MIVGNPTLAEMLVFFLSLNIQVFTQNTKIVEV
jgi:hypothetical protein